MPSPSSSSSSSSSSSHAGKKRRWTREQLMKRLEILGTIPAPLPPELPPSPPPSRTSSPVQGSKRKVEVTNDADTFKRPRISSTVDRQTHHPQRSGVSQTSHSRPSTSTSAANIRTEPSEDGELHEETSSSVAILSRATVSLSAPSCTITGSLPVRRPRRGRPSLEDFDVMYTKYYQQGRDFKYSGDARFFSTFPPGNKEYRPLANPPPPNSQYHIHGALLARLELIDALLSFVYSMWLKDHSRKVCARDNWDTIEAYLTWCKNKWGAEEAMDEAEKAFLGLIFMIEGFIHGRKVWYSIRSKLDPTIRKISKDCETSIEQAIAKAENVTGSSTHATQGATPPMLPSPSSMGTANSANSTPTGRPDGTPNTNTHPLSAPPYFRGQIPGPMHDHIVKNRRNKPIPSDALTAAAAVTVPVGCGTIQDLKDAIGGVQIAGRCLTASQPSITLNVMARLFPATFARMVLSTLNASEEYEPDIDDEEGELFWPPQAATGEGLGWVCLMGKAMTKEFGKSYGYKGLAGLVPKPNPNLRQSSERPTR